MLILNELIYFSIFINCFIVRLVNGPTKYEGTVEVYLHGEWSTIIDSTWDLNDAQVVCNELGYGEAIAATHNAFYGQVISRVLLSGVFCNGTEWTILNCSLGRSYSVSRYSSHSDDAGVQCYTGNVYDLHTHLCSCKTNVF